MVTVRSLTDMDETDFNYGNFKIQLPLFSTVVDSNYIFIEIEILSDFGKNHGQILLTPETANLAKLLLVMLATIPATAKLFSAMKHRCFPVKFAKFLKTPIFINIYEGLHLNRFHHCLRIRVIVKKLKSSAW